jgi:hypothetical protein
MEPELVDRDVALLLELVGPFAAVLVLDILPFGANAFLEEVVVGLEGQFGGGSDIVLGRLLACEVERGMKKTYVDTPEFLDGIEGDDLFQEIIPVVALRVLSVRSVGERLKVGERMRTNLSTRRLGKPQGPFVHKRMLDIEVILVVKDSDLFLAGSIAIGLLILVDSAVRRDRDG